MNRDIHHWVFTFSATIATAKCTWCLLIDELKERSGLVRWWPWAAIRRSCTPLTLYSKIRIRVCGSVVRFYPSLLDDSLVCSISTLETWGSEMCAAARLYTQAKPYEASSVRIQWVTHDRVSAYRIEPTPSSSLLISFDLNVAGRATVMRINLIYIYICLDVL